MPERLPDEFYQSVTRGLLSSEPSPLGTAIRSVIAQTYFNACFRRVSIECMV